VLQFRTPTPQAEKLFEESFNATLVRYRALLSDEAADHLGLINNNFDTGVMTGPGKYRMNDDAYAKLIGLLAEQKFAGASPAVREELLHFYSEPDAPYATKRNVKAWAKVQAQLEQLKAAPPPVVLPSVQPAQVPLPR
jgi:hypothetical protein